MITKWRYVCALVGVLLSISLTPLPAQAAPKALKWVSVDKPGKTGNLVVSPSEVSEIAVGQGDVLYAVDSVNSKVYRSLDAGVSWEDITSYLSQARAGLPASKIAVAPGQSGTVAVVTNNGTQVYLSTDGGTKWYGTGVPTLAGSIQAIGISKEYTQGGQSYWDIAIGTATWGDSTTTGQVWVLQFGGTSWRNENLTIDPAHPGGEVSAIAFSPSYPRDKTILAVASTNADVAAAYQNKTWLCFRQLGAAWDKVTIASAGDGPGVSFIHSSLALPSNYSSDAAESRQLFVSFDREPDADDDVYRINDVTVLRLNADHGSPIDISSIAYYGTIAAGRLLAGDVHPVAGSLTVQVRRTSDPLDASPIWYLSTVPPTGPGNAKVGWSPDGSIAYCGTGQSPGAALDESALSASLDGDRWRQIGLIDTVIEPADIAVAPDSRSLFITSRSAYGPAGIWRTAGTPLGYKWERLLTVDTSKVDGRPNAVILRLSLDYLDDSTMYAAEVSGSQMAVTYNRGNTWEWLEGVPGPIVDVAVVDKQTVYVALPEGYVRRSTDGALIWRGTIRTGLSGINVLSLADKQTILVGGKNGDVAYSTDGGASFTRIRELVGGGDVQVVADANYQQNHTIYAATNEPDEGIWRWTIGVSTQWEQIDESVTDLRSGQRIGGLAVGPEGTLYALRTDPATATSGGVDRSLNPLEPDPEKVEFDLVNEALPADATFDATSVFPGALPYLRLSGNAGENDLWTIDTSNQTIYRFNDTLCKLGPTTVTPQAGEILPIDASGDITDLMLKWEDLTGATKYEAAIYQDADATQSLWSGTSITSGVIATGGAGAATLGSGVAYYWRVRAIEPVKSPWSVIGSFNPALGAAEWSPFAAPVGISPLPGTTNVPIRPAFAWQPADWATGYEFVLAKDNTFTNTVVAMTGAGALPTAVWGCDRNLDYSTTYFWKVRAVNATSYSQWGTGVFTTEPAQTLGQPQSPSPSTTTPAAQATPSYLIWMVIGIGVILVVALLVLVVRTGR